MRYVCRRCFIPPHVADRLGTEIGHPVEFEARLRSERATLLAQQIAPAAPGVLQVYDSGHRQRTTGSLLNQPYSDTAAQEALSGLMATLDVLELLGEVFGQDGLKAYIHYGQDYDNAFWDGVEMVFGDGDGQLFGRFTKAIDVCGHELGHGVQASIFPMNYQGQSGALMESDADAQGSTVRQHALGLSPHDGGAWLIGTKADLFLPAFTGRALRDMLNPGTAYKNDPMLGDDPQPDHMDRYVETNQDDGGVHINSGIPNKAFALAALGAESMAMLGVWRRALATVSDPDCDFATFARATVNAAGSYADIVRGAWVTVGVLDATPAEPPPAPAPEPTPPGSSDDPFREAMAAHPGMAEEVDRLAAEHTNPDGTPWTPMQYVVWRAARDLHLK